jgi:hypothetical protein
MTQHEQMTKMFAAIDDDGQRYVLGVLRGEYERVQQARRPVLRLIECGPAAPTAHGRKQAKGHT